MRVLSKLSFIIILLTGFPCWSIETDGNGTNSAQNNNEISVASWNLKNFGQTKLNDPERIDVIVSVLRKYDIIAIQEVQDISLALPNELITKINAGGENYKVISSERVGRGNRKEQYLFVYDDDVLDFISDTTGFGIEPNDEFSREPFYAMFRAGNFDFYLMTIHTDPDDVVVEIPALKVAYEDLQANTQGEDDIILLGDLNAKAPGATAGSYITMDSIATIPNISFTIMNETNTRGGKAYDNIIFQRNYTTEYSYSSGVYTFWTDYGLTEDDGFKISDHKLVWAKFRIDQPDDDNPRNAPKTFPDLPTFFVGDKPQRTGTIVGMVTWDRVEGIGAQVTIQGTGLPPQTTVANQKGIYRFSGLAPGKYFIKIEQEGFYSQVIDDVEIQVGEEVKLNIRNKYIKADIKDHINTEIAQLSTGNIMFNPAEEMTEQIKERIEVKISQNIMEDLTKGLKGKGIPQLEEIDVSAVMTAKLNGDTFKIIPLCDEEQPILSSGSTLWEWDITPEEAGDKNLQLSISTSIDTGKFGVKKKSHPVMEKLIHVKVNPNIAKEKKTDWSDNIRLIGIIVGALAGLVGIYIGLRQLKLALEKNKLEREKSKSESQKNDNGLGQ